MRVFKNDVEQPDQDLIVIEKELKKSHKQIGVKLLKKGQKLWGLKGGVLAEIPADAYEEIAVMPDMAGGKTQQFRRKLIIDPETFYVIALNRENAVRKLSNYMKVRSLKRK